MEVTDDTHLSATANGQTGLDDVLGQGFAICRLKESDEKAALADVNAARTTTNPVAGLSENIMSNQFPDGHAGVHSFKLL